MAGPQKKNFDTPDERVELGGIAADVVQLGDARSRATSFGPVPTAPLAVAAWPGASEPPRAARLTIPV